MRIFILLLAITGIAGCTSSSSPSITPIADVGCVIETGISGGVASAVAAALNCSNTSAIQSSLQAALGNVNLCSSASSAQSAAASQVKTDSKLSNKAIVGNLLCPVAVNTILGFLSNSIPSAWGCQSGGSASALSSALTSACELAVPL